MAEDQSKVGEILRDYHQVRMASNAYLSLQSSIVGDVELGEEVSVFAGTHIRGDGEPIRIGAGTNIQENCCLHVSGGYALTIHQDVTVGHGAILHGCTIEPNVLIGMGAIVMDGARISSNSFVAAGALVTQNKEFPERSLLMGSPARVARELSDEEVHSMITLAAIDYREVARSMHANGVLVHPPADADIWPPRYASQARG